MELLAADHRPGMIFSSRPASAISTYFRNRYRLYNSRNPRPDSDQNYRTEFLNNYMKAISRREKEEPKALETPSKPETPSPQIPTIRLQHGHAPKGPKKSIIVRATKKSQTAPFSDRAHEDALFKRTLTNETHNDESTNGFLPEGTLRQRGPFKLVSKLRRQNSENGVLQRKKSNKKVTFAIDVKDPELEDELKAYRRDIKTPGDGSEGDVVTFEELMDDFKLMFQTFIASSPTVALVKNQVRRERERHNDDLLSQPRESAAHSDDLAAFGLERTVRSVPNLEVASISKPPKAFVDVASPRKLRTVTAPASLKLNTRAANTNAAKASESPSTKKGGLLPTRDNMSSPSMMGTRSSANGNLVSDRSPSRNYCFDAEKMWDREDESTKQGSPQAEGNLRESSPSLKSSGLVESKKRSVEGRKDANKKSKPFILKKYDSLNGLKPKVNTFLS